MAQLNPRTFADAKQLGDNAFELILTNWGNRGAAADRNNGSIIFPPVAGAPGTGIIPPVPFVLGVPDTLVRGTPVPSLMGIGISPRSNVDRCILQLDGLPQNKQQISYASNKATTSEDPNIIRAGGQLVTEMELSVDAPYIGLLNGPIVLRADSAHWFGDSYHPLGASLPNDSAAFGTALGTPGPTTVGGGPDIWVSPELRILLYLAGKQAPSPPLARAPLRVSFGAAIGSAAPPGPSILLRAIPIMGRRHVSIAITTGALSGQAEFRVTGVVSTYDTLGHRNDEVDLDIAPISIGGSSANESALVNFVNEAPALSWLMIYGAHIGGLNTVSAAITVEAIDR